MKKLSVICLFAVVLALFALTLSGCNPPEPNYIVDIEITSEVDDEVQLGDFDINNYKIRIIMADGTDRFLPIREDRLNTDLSIFDELGAHSLSVTYQGFTKNRIINIVEPVFTVTFEVDGGSTLTPRSTYQIINRPVVSKTDYKFAGWYDNEELEGPQILFPYSVTQDVTLYARWVEDTLDVYNVYFDYNYESAPTYSSYLIVEGNLVYPIPSLTRAGYSFEGWYLDSTLWDFDLDVVNFNLTLYAQWE